jgi:hydrogenase maturation protease
MFDHGCSRVPLDASVKRVLTSFIEQHGRIAIVGLGNEYRTDDGAGVALIRLLENEVVVKTDQVALFEGDRNFVCCLPEIEKLKPSGLLLFDAANLGMKSGTVVALAESQITERRISTHENNFDLAIAYVKMTLPECKILFVGIQFESLETSEMLILTQKTRRAVDSLVRLVADAVSRKGGARHARHS